MNLNKVYLIGRLTQDPEVRMTAAGQSVASFSLATNRTWNDASGQKKEQAEYHNIVVWRRLAEVAGQYLKKGQLLMVEGRLQTRSWVGQDGVKKYRTEIVAENFQMGPKAAGFSGGSTTPGSYAPRPAAPAAPIAPVMEPNPMEEIPIIQVEETSFGEALGEVPVTGEEEVVPF
jgi:single-strand DNA-binding protein